uniref:Uncharacterized protein n=1 Tax=Thermus scotoductus TaxID=37636 RepID=A0A346FPY0_THESC|nr:hypothetical protein [Thermus scotoductus]
MRRRRGIKLLQGQRQPNQPPNRPRQRTPLPRPRHRRRRLRLPKGTQVSPPRVNPYTPPGFVRLMHRKRQGPPRRGGRAFRPGPPPVQSRAFPLQIPQAQIGPRGLLSKPPTSRILPVYGLQLHRRNGARASLFPGPPIPLP